MRNFTRVVIGIGLGIASSAALAEPPTGSRLGDFRRPGPALTAQDEAVGAKQLANCLFAQNNDLSRSVLLAATLRTAQANLERLHGDVRCYNLVFSNELVAERYIMIPDDVLRGMLAEAALEKSGAQMAALQALPLQQKTYQRAWFAVTGRHPSVDEMGACMADTNPAGIAALISTGPVSKEETAAFAGLTYNLGKCLQAGTRLEASLQALRAALAEALFQRLNAPAPEPAAATTAEATKK